MTRDEAINRICSIKNDEDFKKAKEAINKIYDDFDEKYRKLKKHDRSMRDYAHKFDTELQQIKARTCESCKYSKDIKQNKDFFICSNDELQVFSHFNIAMKKDFCCNKWQAKSQ